MLRPETRARARALQLLYAWEIRGRPPLSRIVEGLTHGSPQWLAPLERGERLAADVAAGVETLDGAIADALEHWRPSRVGVIERCVLRIGLHELTHRDTPPKVAISEAVLLARLFAGPRAPAFVNGVLDALARRAGRL